MAMTGGIEQALNDAYAEGRKDEREAWITAPQPLKDQA
jgi:sulfite reductase alpha subunit-like flavoprotein